MRRDALARSEWTFKTRRDYCRARRKKLSSVELAQDAIARIESHDGKINAICVRDFSRALEAARAADDAALARVAAAARHSR